MAEVTFSTTLSTDPEAGVAEERTVAALLAELGGAPDLLLVFCSRHYGDALHGLGERLGRATGARALAGGTGVGVVGAGQEIEARPALALFGARLGETRVQIEHVSARATADGGALFRGRPQIERTHRAGMILLANPASFPAHLYLPELSDEFEGVPVVGGLINPEPGLLWSGSKCHTQGALAITLEGEVQIEPIVSQGCRPVGDPLVVTACRGPVIEKLRGRRAQEVLLETLAGLSERDRELFRCGAHIGLAVDPTLSRFQAEDLLVRNLRGVDPRRGWLIVADHSLRAGMSVQFMVRDAAGASRDLEEHLERVRRHPTPARTGGLLFTCGGRGASLFPTLHHDASTIERHLGPGFPLAGMFCAGEIGPVGGRPYLHGFTASLAYLRSAEDARGE